MQPDPNLDYVEQMLTALWRIAKARRKHMLAYLIGMALIECGDKKGRRSS